MQTEKNPNESLIDDLQEMEIDAIGEILNISMGSAATALSSMLDKKVIITTPKVSVKQISELDYSEMEPAIIVKITYIKGITGSNIMMFRQRDMQIILNHLMGIEDEPSDDYVFDEMSISAASEVMNQMMGASSTALSEFLGRSINISIPTATILDDENTFEQQIDMDLDSKAVVTVFDLDIDGTVSTEFFSVLSVELSKMIVNQFMGATTEEVAEPVPEVQAAPETPHVEHTVDTQQTPPMQQMPQMQEVPPHQMPPQPYPPQQAAPPQYQPGPQGQSDQYPQQPLPYPQAPQGYYPPPPMYPMQYPYGYPGYPAPPQEHAQNEKQVIKNPLNVQQVQFPDFSSSQPVFAAPLTSGNIDMLMNVPLNVSIEIGRTKRKIRDIMDFNQGSIIELEKQAGAPVDIIVNGQLIARGDVVVIDDNFAVRVTEILGTKELINSVEAGEK